MPYREYLQRRSTTCGRDKTTRRRAGTSGSRTGTLAALPKQPEGIKLGWRFRYRSEPFWHRRWAGQPGVQQKQTDEANIVFFLTESTFMESCRDAA